MARRTSFQWFKLWVLWVAATVGGLLVDQALFRGMGASRVLIDGVLEWGSGQGLNLALVEVLAGALLGLIDGVIIGVLQWIALRRILRRAGHWVLATAIGTAAALAAFYALLGLFPAQLLRGDGGLETFLWLGILDGMIGGLVLGSVQWLALRGEVRDAAWWILALAVISPAAFLVRWFMSIGLGQLFLAIVGGIVLLTLVALSEAEADAAAPPPAPAYGA